MFIILFRRPRWPWSTLRSIIARRQPFRRNAQTAACPAKPTDTRGPNSNEVEIHHEVTTQAPNVPNASIARDIPCRRDTDLTSSQLAGLAATVSQSPPRDAAYSQRSSSSSVLRTANTVFGGNGNEELEEENFQYLRSLITVSCTVSCLSTESSRLNLSPSLSDETGPQPVSHKRVSSRLSLRLGELPSVALVPNVRRKPCPRYTCLPPV